VHVIAAMDKVIQARQDAWVKTPGLDKGQYQRNNHQSEIAALEKSREGLKKFVSFICAAKAKVAKPMVYKTRRGGYHSFAHRGNYVKPNVRLVYKDQDIEVQDREFLALERKAYKWDQATGNNVSYIAPSIPAICQKNFSVAYFGDDKETQQINDAIVADCGEALQLLDQTIRQEWDRVEGALDQIIEDHRTRKGPKDRKIFQEKMSEQLAATKGLIEADPASILAIFKLGHIEIEILMRYAKRNRHEVDLVELEDIVEAQALAKVKNVMKS